MKDYYSILFFLLSITFCFAQNNHIHNIGDAGAKNISLNYTIKDIKVVDGKIIIYGNAGEGNPDDNGTNEDSQQELELGRDYTIVDASGKIFNIDENGNITDAGTLAKGGGSNPQNTDGVDKNGKATAITAKGIKVSFENHPDSKYAFEKPSQALNKYYQKVSGDFIPFKAVENQRQEPFIAKVEITDNLIKADSLVFKTSDGKLIDATKIGQGSDFNLTLKGTFDFETEQVQAVIKQGEKYKIAGVFNLVHLSQKTIKLNLVPTTGVEISDETIKKIKDIYGKVAVNMEVKVKDAFDFNPYLVAGKLLTNDTFGDLSTYSPAQNAIIKDYQQKNQLEEAYYIFLTDKPSSNGQSGYMRLNGQFGFVFENNPKVIAHEIGHGALKLEHTFKEFKLGKGKTNSLMDYPPNEQLLFPHWKQINDPKLKLYTFQEQTEGEIAGGYGIAPNWEFVRTNTNVVQWTNTNVQDGFIYGFIHNDKHYQWDGTQYPNDYKTIKIDFIKDSDIIWLFYNNSKNCKSHKYIRTTFKEIKSIIVNRNHSDLIAFIKTYDSQNDTSKVTYSAYLGCGTSNANNENTSLSGNSITNYSSKEVDVKTLLNQIDISSSKTGIKGRIFITDNSTPKERITEVENAINELKKSNRKEIYIWAKDYVDEKTFSLEVAVGGGLGDKQIAINSLIAQTNSLKNMPWAGKFNPLTAIFDGLAWLVGQAEIPEKFYNPNDKDYNPFPAQLYGAVSGATLKDTIFGVKDNTFNTVVVEFAYLCGLWNGAVNIVAALPEGASFVVKMITNENKTRDNTFDAINKLSIDTIT